MEKSALNLSDHKLDNMLFCWKCYFFPLSADLPYLIISKTIFNIEWECPLCSHINLQRTDQSYRIYPIQQSFIIDEAPEHHTNICIIILVSDESKQTFVNLPMHPQLLGTDQINRKSMSEDSCLLLNLLNSQALEERKKRGRNFSWNSFMQRREISKLEYSLWMADSIKNEIKAKILICSKEGKKKFDRELDRMWDKKVFISYSKHGEEAFCNINDPQIIIYLQEHQFNFVILPSQEDSQAFKNLKIKGQWIFLEGDRQDLHKHKRQENFSHQLVTIYKYPFFDGENNLCTEKKYISKKIGELCILKFKIIVFMKKFGEKFKIIFSKTQNEKHTQETAKRLDSADIFKKDKNRNFKQHINELFANLQQKQKSQDQIERACDAFLVKLPQKTQIRVFLQIYSHQTNKKKTIFYNKIHLEEQSSQKKQDEKQSIDVIEELENINLLQLPDFLID